MNEFLVKLSDDGYPAIWYSKPIASNGEIKLVEILNLEDEYDAELICAWLNRANEFGELFSKKIKEEIQNAENKMPLEGYQDPKYIKYHEGRLEALNDVFEWIGEIMDVFEDDC